MKNLTVSLPEDIYRRARLKAAERETSVSALVREYLIQLCEEATETDFDRRKRMQGEILDSIQRFRAGDRVSRDQAHDRDGLR